MEKKEGLNKLHFSDERKKEIEIFLKQLQGVHKERVEEEKNDKGKEKSKQK